MNKKDLVRENDDLKKENEFLLKRNKELLRDLGMKMVELNETKRIYKIENSRLWHRIDNPVINLPSGRQLDIKSLNLEQLEYLESLLNENINRM